MRSATEVRRPYPRSVHRFNPRTPCGVRPFTRGRAFSLTLFQSTHSLRSATKSGFRECFRVLVSIHALLAECDNLYRIGNTRLHGFNPRTPCGVRQSASNTRIARTSFQSTHSLRSATPTYAITYLVCGVSIHALLAECDA